MIGEILKVGIIDICIDNIEKCIKYNFSKYKKPIDRGIIFMPFIPIIFSRVSVIQSISRIDRNGTLNQPIIVYKDMFLDAPVIYSPYVK